MSSNRHKFAARRGSDADSDVDEKDADDLDAELSTSLTQLPPIDTPFQPRTKEELDDESPSEKTDAADCSAEFEMLNRLTHEHVPNQNELILGHVKTLDYLGSGSGSSLGNMNQTVSNPPDSTNGHAPSLKEMAERYVALRIWSQRLKEVDKALNAKAMQILPLIATQLPNHSRPLITRDQHLVYQVMSEKKAASVDPKLTDEILAKIMPKISDEDKEAIKRHPKRLMPIRLHVLKDVLGKERSKEPWKRAKAYAAKKAPGGGKKYMVRIIPHPEAPGILMPPSEMEADKRLSRAFLNDPIGFNGLIKTEQQGHAQGRHAPGTLANQALAKDSVKTEPIVKPEPRGELVDTVVKKEEFGAFADTSRRPPMRVFTNDPHALSGAIDLCNAMDTSTDSKNIDHVLEASELVKKFSSSSIVCFTDGGASPNPGYCGAGTVICVPTASMKLAEVLATEGAWDEAWKGLGHGTNNIAELSAIELALDILDEMEATVGHKFKASALHILTDSTYAQGVLSGTMKAKANSDLVKQIKTKIANRSKTIPVTIHWVKGHAGVPGNERADQLAKRAVENISPNLGRAPNKCLSVIRTVERILQEQRQAKLPKVSTPVKPSSDGTSLSRSPAQDEFDQMRRAFAQTMPVSNVGSTTTPVAITTVAAPTQPVSTSVPISEPRIAALSSVKVPSAVVANTNTNTEVANTKNSAENKDKNTNEKGSSKKHKRKRERSSSPESSAASGSDDDESDDDKSTKADKKKKSIKNKKSKKNQSRRDDNDSDDDEASKKPKSKNKKSKSKSRKNHDTDSDSGDDSATDEDNNEPRRKKAKVDKKKSTKGKKSSATQAKTPKKNKKRDESSDSGSDSD